jgi:hypothetical protein
MLLFISDEVFGACLHSSALDAADRVGKEFASKVWVGTEALPVATAFG